MKLLSVNKKQIIFILVVCLMGLGLWQLSDRDDSSTELLGPSSFDFTNSNHPQADFFSEKDDVILKDDLSTSKHNLEKTEKDSKSIEGKLAGLSFESRQKFEIVQDILSSKNDNDPRIDVELKTLDPLLKLVLQEKYNQLAEENRNQRGLLIYLISREIQSEQDLTFIKTVYEEPPCMSLSDCRSAGDFNPHMDSVNQVTLDYPQKVGLYQLEKSLVENAQLLSNPSFRKAAIELLQTAEKFPVPSIQKQAQKIRLKYHL